MTKQKFINQWLRHFAHGINKNQYKKYVEDQYIWHVFSWELIKPDGLLIGDAARQAYNDAMKTECIFCDIYNNGGVTDKLSPQYDTAEKIDENTTVSQSKSRPLSATYWTEYKKKTGSHEEGSSIKQVLPTKKTNV